MADGPDVRALRYMAGHPTWRGPPTCAGCGLVVRGLISRLLSDDVVDEDGNPVPPPPDADPRGASVLRGAYGPWLAAREAHKEMEGRP